MSRYIWENQDWPKFFWDENKIIPLEQKIINNEGFLKGLISSLETDYIQNHSAKMFAKEIERSWRIEGEKLEELSVYSSVCRKLNIESQVKKKESSHIDGIVDVSIDAIMNDDKKLYKERLFKWHSQMFSNKISEGTFIICGGYREDSIDVVSGELGKEIILYTAVPAEIVDSEMFKFFNWINNDYLFSNFVKSAIAHLWFLTIHPFEDGNGRLARVISDFVLYQNRNINYSFYSISSEIRLEQKNYYKELNKAQTADNLDITNWLIWYLECINNSINNIISEINHTIKINKFYSKINSLKLNKRQKKMIDKILNDFKGNINTSKWAKICNCSQDTATRDLKDLIEKGIFKINIKGPKTNYEIIF